jgi:hypothetical protein
MGEGCLNVRAPRNPAAPARSYDDGLCHSVGVAHSGAVTALQVSPDKTRIVSVGAEGGIFVWAYAAPLPLADPQGA